MSHIMNIQYYAMMIVVLAACACSGSDSNRDAHSVESASTVSDSGIPTVTDSGTPLDDAQPSMQDGGDLGASLTCSSYCKRYLECFSVNVCELTGGSFFSICDQQCRERVDKMSNEPESYCFDCVMNELLEHCFDTEAINHCGQACFAADTVEAAFLPGDTGSKDLRLALECVDGSRPFGRTCTHGLSLFVPSPDGGHEQTQFQAECSEQPNGDFSCACVSGPRTQTTFTLPQCITDYEDDKDSILMSHCN